MTDEHNVGLFRQWENADSTYLHILRFIRISGEFADAMHITRPGRDGVKKGISKGGVSLAEAVEMDIASEGDEASVEASRVGSNMLAMDEIPS